MTDTLIKTFSEFIDIQLDSLTDQGKEALRASKDNGSYSLQHLHTLPLKDRLTLYSEACALTPLLKEEEKKILPYLASGIRLHDRKTTEIARQIILDGQNQSQSTHAANKDDYDFNGFTTQGERNSLKWLYLALMVNLPQAIGKEPTDFLKENLDETERGIFLACLNIESGDEWLQRQSAPIQRNHFYDVTLTPDLWKSFKLTQLLYATNTKGWLPHLLESTLDNILLREITKQTPDELATMTLESAMHFAIALNGHGMTGSKSDLFIQTQDYFYEHLSVPHAITEMRETQIEKITDKFSRMSDGALDDLVSWKKDWAQLPDHEIKPKLEYLKTTLAYELELPSHPALEIELHPLAHDNSDQTHASYRDWVVVENERGGPARLWKNQIIFHTHLDDEGEKIPPRSLRTDLRALAHELTHASDQQNLCLLEDHDDFIPFQLLFSQENAPKALDTQCELGKAYQLLAETYGDTGRKEYVSFTDHYTRYGYQPFEKWAYRFDQSFASGINGVLVRHAVERGQRHLHEDLLEVLQKAGRALVIRAATRGDDHVFMDMHDYVPPPEEITDDKNFANNTKAIQTLQTMMWGAIEQEHFSDKEYEPLYGLASVVLKNFSEDMQAFGDLIESAQKEETDPEMKPEYTKTIKALKHFEVSCRELSEDLADYLFITARDVNRPTRPIAKKKRKAPKKRSTSPALLSLT